MNNSNQQGNQTDVAILKDVALFDFIIGGSTGEKTVEADDFIREVGKMLPKVSFSWVSKYRNEAKREILKVGVSRKVNKRVRGYFVPVAYAQDLSKKLLEIKAKYLVEKETMLQQLPKLIEEWADSPANKVTSKPGGESRADLIRRHAPKKDDLERGLSFDISAIQINATSYFGADDALQAEVVGLVGQAAMEIAEDVKRSWTGATSGKTTSRVLGVVRRVQEKAEAMGIISSKFENLAKMCKRVLDAIQPGQSIEGLEFLQVSTLLTFCSSPENILSEQSAAFDPLAVEEPSTPAASTVQTSAPQPGTQIQPGQNAKIVPPAQQSVVPPLPTDMGAFENLFFEGVKTTPPDQTDAEQEIKPESKPGGFQF